MNEPETEPAVELEPNPNPVRDAAPVVDALAALPPHEASVGEPNDGARKHYQAPVETGNASTHGAIQRLHWATVCIPVLEKILGMVVPMIIIGTLIGNYYYVVLFAFWLIVVPATLFHVVRVLTVRYRLKGAELIIQSGLITRRERRISFDRVQDTEIQQGIFYRIFGLAKLEITTAGSDAQEALLDVLSRTAAEAIKDSVAVYQKGPREAGEQESTKSVDMPRCLCQLSLRDLVMGGLTSNLVASVIAIIGTILYFKSFLDVEVPGLKGVEQRVADRVGQALPEGRFFEMGTGFFFGETLGKSLLFALGGFLVAIASYAIRYHGFRLTRLGDVLSKAHGLFRVRKSSLGRNRVQALKIEEGLLRRWFGLAAVRVDSAGDRYQIDESKKRDVLVPVISRTASHALAREIIPDLVDAEPTWKKISRLAIMRGSKKGWLLVLVLMVQTSLMSGWLCLSWLPAIPLVYLLNYQWYRNTGYWVEEKYLMSRKGWLNRETLFLPVKNIQNVSVTQSYFDRRLDLATLSVDTAGQSNTGGGPVIRHLPVDEARRIQRLLARRVVSCEIVW